MPNSSVDQGATALRVGTPAAVFNGESSAQEAGGLKRAQAVRGPLVSAIIPTYNYGRFVCQAVESALAQTYANVEVIVVDDGSTDDTRARLAPYMEKIRYVYQENQGLSAARNTGIREAKGDLVAFLDSDDAWHPRKLELQVACLADRPEIALLGADAVGDIDKGWPEINKQALAVGRSVTLEQLLLKSRFCPSSVLARKECFSAVGVFDTELRSVEDRDMWLRIVQKYGVAKLEMPLCFYRLHPASMSNTAARMEHYEHHVLQKTFAAFECLRGRFLLKRKTFGWAAASGAYMYSMAGAQGIALRRIVRSLLLWPFPYPRKEVKTALVRPKLLIMILLRIARIKGSESQPVLHANRRQLLGH